VQVWDLAMEARPVRVIPVHDFLKPKLVELYETDCIFDKFEVATAGDGTSVMTGSYNNSFKIYDVLRGSETTVELTKAHPQPPVVRRIMGGLGIGRDAVPAPLYSASADPFAPDTEKTWSTDSDITMGNTPTQARSTYKVDDEPEYEQFASPPDVADIDFSKKVLHFSWHPSEDIVAVAGVNSLYVYHAL
jgi:serine/threonine-protein phosphatase 2A regulatory subunit B